MSNEQMFGIFNIQGQIHTFSINPKIGCYRLAYYRQNIRIRLKFLYAITRTYLQCLIYIRDITNLEYFNT